MFELCLPACSQLNEPVARFRAQAETLRFEQPPDMLATCTIPC